MPRSEIVYLLRTMGTGAASMAVYLVLAYILDYVFVARGYKDPYMMSQMASTAVSVLLSFLMHVFTFEISLRQSTTCLMRYLVIQVVCYVISTLLFFVMLRSHQATRRAVTERKQRLVNTVFRAIAVVVTWSAAYALYRLWVFVPNIAACEAKNMANKRVNP